MYIKCRHTWAPDFYRNFSYQAQPVYSFRGKAKDPSEVTRVPGPGRILRFYSWAKGIWKLLVLIIILLIIGNYNPPSMFHSGKFSVKISEVNFNMFRS